VPHDPSGPQGTEFTSIALDRWAYFAASSWRSAALARRATTPTARRSTGPSGVTASRNTGLPRSPRRARSSRRRGTSTTTSDRIRAFSTTRRRTGRPTVTTSPVEHGCPGDASPGPRTRAPAHSPESDLPNGPAPGSVFPSPAELRQTIMKQSVNTRFESRHADRLTHLPTMYISSSATGPQAGYITPNSHCLRMLAVLGLLACRASSSELQSAGMQPLSADVSVMRADSFGAPHGTLVAAYASSVGAHTLVTGSSPYLVRRFRDSLDIQVARRLAAVLIDHRSGRSSAVLAPEDIHAVVRAWPVPRVGGGWTVLVAGDPSSAGSGSSSSPESRASGLVASQLQLWAANVEVDGRATFRRVPTSMHLPLAESGVMTTSSIAIHGDSALVLMSGVDASGRAGVFGAWCVGDQWTVERLPIFDNLSAGYTAAGWSPTDGFVALASGVWLAPRPGGALRSIGPSSNTTPGAPPSASQNLMSISAADSLWLRPQTFGARGGPAWRDLTLLQSARRGDPHSPVASTSVGRSLYVAWLESGPGEVSTGSPVLYQNPFASGFRMYTAGRISFAEHLTFLPARRLPATVTASLANRPCRIPHDAELLVVQTASPGASIISDIEASLLLLATEGDSLSQLVAAQRPFLSHPVVSHASVGDTLAYMLGVTVDTLRANATPAAQIGADVKGPRGYATLATIPLKSPPCSSTE
jgi:hypothetical protein